MAINRYRHVSDEDDGCERFQCMMCYKQFTVRCWRLDWEFCPCCGTRWEAMHLNDTTREELYQEVPRNAPKESYWTVEERTVYNGNLCHSSGNWNECLRVRKTYSDAADVALKKYQDLLKEEEEAILLDEDEGEVPFFIDECRLMSIVPGKEPKQVLPRRAS